MDVLLTIGDILAVVAAYCGCLLIIVGSICIIYTLVKAIWCELKRGADNE